MGPRKGKEKKVDKAKVILCVFSHDHRYLISTLQGCFGISLTPGNIFYVKELKNVYYLLLCNLLTLTQSGNLGILKVCLCTSVEIGIFFNPLVTCLWNFISSVNIFGVLVVVVFFFFTSLPLFCPPYVYLSICTVWICSWFRTETVTYDRERKYCQTSKCAETTVGNASLTRDFFWKLQFNS